MTATVSRHAVKRYTDRVDSTCDVHHAEMILSDFLSDGIASGTPRQWMRAGSPCPRGSRFVYSDRYPGICLIVKDGVVATVVTRETCRPKIGR